jgi:hypothetical protein
MKKGCLIALGVPLGLVVALIVFLWFNFYAVHVRFRLTMEVQDGDQLKIGSSVIDVAFPIEPDWSPSHRTGDTTPVGYAPTVDLAEKGMLFLTFQTLARNGEQQREYNRQVACTFDDVGCLPFAAYRKSGDFAKAAVEKAQLAEVLRQGGPRDVPFATLPRLVRFRDINDPTTRVLVSPYDIAAHFGPGVELKRVILQLTDDPVTPPPQSWPQWLTIRRENTVFRGYERD